MLKTTLTLTTIDGIAIPFQNGIPVPSYEPQERETISLHGVWRKQRFAADHDFSMRPRDAAWLEELERREGTWLRGSFAEQWEEHLIPSPENALSGEERAGSAETYEDGVWYRRMLQLDEVREDAVYMLKSLGMNYIADLWVNGQWIGYHEGGFTPFAFDVTPHLRDGENDVRIRIDNPPWGSRSDIIPAVASTDFFNYTGIVQEVYIEVLPVVHVVRADVVPLDTDGRLRVTVVLANRGGKPQGVQLCGRLYEGDRDRADYLASPLASSIIGREASVAVSEAHEGG
jgi:beta-galactosidase